MTSYFAFLQHKKNNRAFYGFGQAKFAYGGSVSGSSQFTLLPKLPLKSGQNRLRKNHLDLLI